MSDIATPEQVVLRRFAESMRRVAECVDRTLPKQYREGVQDGLRIASRTADEIAAEWGLIPVTPRDRKGVNDG